MDIGFVGEIECKLDSKARILVPKAFLKQMPAVAIDRLIANRGSGKYIDLFTAPEWNRKTEPFRRVNSVDEEDMKVIRAYVRNANILDFDANNRIMIPQKLKDYAGLDKDVIMIGIFGKIELWAKDVYEEELKKQEDGYKGVSKFLPDFQLSKPQGDEKKDITV